MTAEGQLQNLEATKNACKYRKTSEVVKKEEESTRNVNIMINIGYIYMQHFVNPYINEEN